jgi:exopolysaccharide production protein ExoQ
MGKRSGMTTSTTHQNPQEAYVIYALGFLFLPVAAIAAAQTWVLAILGVVAILAFRAVHGQFWPKPNGLLVVLMGLFVGWAALSSIWTINPDRAIKTAIRLALVAASLLVLIDAADRLDHTQRRKFGRWLIGGTVLGLSLTGVFIASSGAVAVWFSEARLTGHELAQLNRTSSIIAMLAWPVALIVAQIYNRYAAATVIGLSAVVLFMLAPSTPVVAFFVGVCAFSITWFSHRLGKRFLILAFAAAVIVIPLLGTLAPLAIEFLIANVPWPNSEVHRLVIWQFASERIFENPLFGWGLDASRAIPGGGDDLFLFQVSDSPITGRAMPLHPHNALVQIWLELGLLGVMLVGAIFSLAVAGIPESTSNRAGPATLVATTACAFTIVQLGFGIWQGWWMASLGLIVMIAVATCLHPPATK